MKRVLKVFGIVFGVAILIFGAIIGVMAIRGDFKKPHIEPTKLYFESGLDYMDVIYYCEELDTKGGKQSNVYSFTLKAEPADVTELKCKMVVESGEELIDFCNADGEVLEYEDNSQIKIGKPVYFKINPRFDNTNEGYNLTNGEVHIYFNSENDLCNAYLTINIDRQVSAISLKDQNNSANNVHQKGQFVYEKEIFEKITITEKPDSWDNYFYQGADGYVAVSPEAEFDAKTVYYYKTIDKTLNIAVSANSEYLLEPIYAPENSNQPFTSVEGKVTDMFIKNGHAYENIKNTSSVNIVQREGDYYFVSAEPGEHELYLVSYPTYEKQKQAQEFFDINESVDNLIFNNEFSIMRKVNIRVENYGIKTVKFNDGLNPILNVFEQSEFVVNAEEVGKTNLGIEMRDKNNVIENSRLNQIKFFDKDDFVQGKIEFVASNKGTENGKAKIVIDRDNAILSNFDKDGVNGQHDYQISIETVKKEPTNPDSEVYTYFVLTILFGEQGLDLQLKFDDVAWGDNLYRAKHTTKEVVSESGVVASGEMFTARSANMYSTNGYGDVILLIKKIGTVYQIGSIKPGSYLVFLKDNATNQNANFDITNTGYGANKTFAVTPKVKLDGVNLNLFIVNEDLEAIHATSAVQIKINETDPVFTKETDLPGLKIVWQESAVETSEINCNNLVKDIKGSYKLPLFFVEASETRVHTLNTTISKNGTTYKLVGYMKEQKFVNAVKPVDDAMGEVQLYTVFLSYDYSVKSSEALATGWLTADYLDTDLTNDADAEATAIDLKYVVNQDFNEKENNKITISIKYANQIAGGQLSEIKFKADIFEANAKEIESVTEYVDTELTSNESYEINENYNINKMSVSLDGNFKRSGLFSQFIDGEGYLVKLNEYFKIAVSIYTGEGSLVQKGVIEMKEKTPANPDDPKEYEFNINNKDISKYIEILSVTFNSNMDGGEDAGYSDDGIDIVYRVINDPLDSYVGHVESGRVKGYYFKIEFDYEGNIASSPKIVIKSSAVQEYRVKVGSQEYRNEDYTIVYKLNYNASSGYGYDLYLENKADPTTTILLVSGVSNLTDEMMLNNSSTYSVVAYPNDSDDKEFKVSNSNESVISISGTTISLLKVGETKITLTNTTVGSVQTVFDVRIDKGDFAFNELNTTTAVAVKEYSLADVIKFTNDTEVLTNAVYGTDVKFVTFTMKNLSYGYEANYEEVLGVGYTDYIRILDKTYRKVAEKPAGWEGFSSAEIQALNYYLLGSEGYTQIKHAFKYYVVDIVNWDTFEFATGTTYYKLDEASGEYIELTEKPTEAIPLYTRGDSNWVDDKVYSLNNLVASIRWKDGEGWKIVRENKYLVSELSFDLVAESITGEQTYKFGLTSSVKIEKNRENPMVEDQVITYYRGTVLLLATNEAENALYKLSNNTGEGTFTLQYLQNNNSWSNRFITGLTGYDQGPKLYLTEDTLANIIDYIETNPTNDYAPEIIDGAITARIFFNEYKYTEFKFRIVDNLVISTENNSKTNAQLLDWDKPDKKQIILDESKFKAYMYKSNAIDSAYVSYLGDYLKVQDEGDITFKLEPSDEYSSIIKQDEDVNNKIVLNWVGYSGTRLYTLKMTATVAGNNAEFDYFVEVTSDFNIGLKEEKELPTLNPYEEKTMSFAGNFYSESILKDITLVKYAEYDENNARYGEWVTGSAIGTKFDINTDSRRLNLKYNEAKGGKYLLVFNFTIDIDPDAVTEDLRNIVPADNLGNEIAYEITVNDYKLKFKEDAYLVRNGEYKSFVDLFNENFNVDPLNEDIWDKISSVTVDFDEENRKVISNSNSLTVNSANKELKLSVNEYAGDNVQIKMLVKALETKYIYTKVDISDWDSFVYEIGKEYYTFDSAKRVYVLQATKPQESVTLYTKEQITEVEYEYTQFIPVKDNYYATVNTKFIADDMKLEINKANVVLFTGNSAWVDKLSASMYYDLALSGETLNVASQFTVFDSTTGNATDKTLNKIELVGAIGYNYAQCSEIACRTNEIVIAGLNSSGYLFFKLSNESSGKNLASCYYLVFVVPNKITSAEDYRNILTDREENVIKEDFTYESDKKITDIITTSVIKENVTDIDNIIDDATAIKYYLQGIEGNYSYNGLRIGADITNSVITEPLNACVIKVAIVLVYDYRKVHILNAEITFLPNITVAVGSDDNISKLEASEVKQQYNLEVKYDYTLAEQEIDLESLFTVTKGSDVLELKEVVVAEPGFNTDLIALDGKIIKLFKNISEKLEYSLTLKYEIATSQYYLITVNLTYLPYDRGVVETTLSRGWDAGNKKFDYNVAFAGIIGSYEGPIDYYIDGNLEVGTFDHDTTIDFFSYADKKEQKIKTLRLVLNGIEGTPYYEYTVVLEPTIYKQINKGTELGNFIEVDNEDDNHKLPITIEEDATNSHIKVTIKDAGNTVLYIKDNPGITYDFKNDQGQVDNSYLIDRGILVDETPIKFVATAGEYKGRLVLHIDGYNDIELYVNLKQSYAPQTVQPTNFNTKETFVVGDNLTFEEFILGKTNEFTKITSTTEYIEDKYYYYDKSSNRYLVASDSYLFNWYGTNLITIDECTQITDFTDIEYTANKYYYNSDSNYILISSAQMFSDKKTDNNVYTISYSNLARNAVYVDTTSYYYKETDGTLTGLSNDSTEDNYIFKYLFNKDKSIFYNKVTADSINQTIERYVLIDPIKDEYKADTYYRFVNNKAELLVEATFNSTSKDKIYKKEAIVLNKDRVIDYQSLTTKGSWEDGKYYKLVDKKYVLLTETEFDSMDATDIYTLRDLWSIWNSVGLNELVINAYTYDGGSYVLDSSKSFVNVDNENKIIYFVQENVDIMLELTNLVGLNLKYYLRINTAEQDINNIKVNETVAGVIEPVGVIEPEIEYVSTTLEQLKSEKGFTLATLTYMPSKDNMFVLYNTNTDSYFYDNGIIYCDTEPFLTYSFDDKLNLVLKADSSITSYPNSLDLEFINQNGVVKVLRLYISDLTISTPETTPEVYANSEGIKLNELGAVADKLIIFDGATIIIDEALTTVAAGYSLEYTGAKNQTYGKWIEKTNTSLIEVDATNQLMFKLKGVKEDNLLTLYYNVCKEIDGKTVIIGKFEYNIIIKNNLVITAGSGFEWRGNAYNGELYLNNYSKPGTEYSLDLINKNGGGELYRDEYIVYKDLLTDFEINGDSSYINIKDYLKFEIVSHTYTSSKEPIINDSGVITIKEDKDAQIVLNVIAQFGSGYVRQFILNIHSSVSLSARYQENEAEQNGLTSGTSVNLISYKYTDAISPDPMFRLYSVKTNSSYTDIPSELASNLTINYGYYIHDDMDKMLDDYAKSRITFTTGGTYNDKDTLSVNLPVVPLDGREHYVTYELSFKVNDTTQKYLCSFVVRNGDSLTLNNNYIERQLIINGTDSCISGDKLYLYIESGNSLFTNDSNIITTSGNKVKLKITEGLKSEAYYPIQKGVSGNYYIDLTSPQTSDGTGISDALFANSMEFDLVFTNSDNVELYTETGFTLTSATDLSGGLNYNKPLKDIFTTSELGTELASKKFSLITNIEKDGLTGSNFTTDEDLSLNNSSINLVKTITRTVVEGTSYTYAIYSATLTASAESVSYYKNEITTYYVKSNNPYFIQLTTGSYRIAKEFEFSSEAEITDQTIDLSDTLKAFANSSTSDVTVSAKVNIEENNPDNAGLIIDRSDDSSLESATIKLTADYLRLINTSGNDLVGEEGKQLSFNIKVNYGGGDVRIISVDITVKIKPLV